MTPPHLAAENEHINVVRPLALSLELVNLSHPIKLSSEETRKVPDKRP